MQKMTTNDVIIRHNFISKVIFKDGDATLSKNLKVKIMSMRIEYGKIHKFFDEDVQEFTKGIIDDRFNELSQKSDRTEEETKEYNDLINKYNNETNDYINSRATDVVEVKEFSFDMDEYSEILETNSSNDVTINDTKIPAPDFLEVLYELFVKEDEAEKIDEAAE